MGEDDNNNNNNQWVKGIRGCWLYSLSPFAFSQFRCCCCCSFRLLNCPPRPLHSLCPTFAKRWRWLRLRLARGDGFAFLFCSDTEITLQRAFHYAKRWKSRGGGGGRWSWCQWIMGNWRSQTICHGHGGWWVGGWPRIRNQFGACVDIHPAIPIYII